MGEFSVSVKATANTKPFEEQIKAMNNKHTVSVKAKVVITKKSIQDQISAIDLNNLKIPVKINSAELKKSINDALETITSQKSGLRANGIKVGFSKDQIVGELNRVFGSITNKFTVAVRVTKKQLRDEIKSKLDGVEINAKIKGNKDTSSATKSSNAKLLENSDSDGLISKVSKWYLAQIPIRLLGQALQETKQAVTDFDASLTEFRKVSDLGGSSLQTYVDELGELGQTVARTRAEMTDLATEFKKSGFTDEEAKTLSQVGAMYQNVADSEVSASKAAGFITSQLRAFNMEASSGIKVVDKVNEVSNNFAVSSTNIADGMSKTSSAFASFGNDIDQTIALITAGTEILANQPGKVSKGLRSIGAEIVKIAGESGKLDVSVNGSAQSIELVNEKTGELVSTYDVLDKVSTEYWGKMTEQEKTDLALKLGMKNQYETFTATISNWSQAQRAYTTALESSGSAERENERYMDSLSAKVNQLKANFGELILGSGGLGNFSKTLLDIGNTLLTALNNPITRTIVTVTAFITTVNLLSTALSKLSQMQVFNAFSKFGQLYKLIKADEINKFLSTFEGVGARAFDGISGGMRNLSVSAKALGSTLKETWSALSMGTKVISVVGIALMAYSAISNAVKEHKEEERAAYEKAIQTQEESKGKIEEYTNKLNENNKAIEKNIQAINNRKNATFSNKNIEILKEENHELELNILLEKKKKEKSAKEAYDKGKEQSKDDTRYSYTGASDHWYTRDWIEEAYSKVTRKNLEYAEDYLPYSKIDSKNSKEMQETLNSLNDPTDIDNYADALSNLSEELKRTKEEQANLNDSEDDYEDKSKQNEKAISNLDKKYTDSVDKIKQLRQRSKDYQSTLDSNSDKYKELQEEIDRYDDVLEDARNYLKDTNSEEEDKASNLAELQKGYADTNKSLSDTSTSIDEMQSAWDTLSSAQEAYNQCGYLTLDQFQGILNVQPQYLAALMDENGQLQFNAEGFQALSNQMLLAKIQQLEYAAAQEIAVSAGKELQVSEEASGAGAVGLSNNLVAVGNTAVDVANRVANLGANVEHVLSMGGIHFGDYDVGKADEIINKYKNIAKSLADMSKNINYNKGAINQNTGAVGGNSKAHGGNTGARNKNTGAIDKQTKALEKQKQALQDQIDKLEEQKTEYENTFKYLERLENEKKEKTEAQQKKDEDAVNKKYDKLVKPLEKQKEKLEDRNYELEKQISAMEKKADKELEKLERQNDELDKMTEKEKLLLDLAKAKEQHKMVYRDGVGFVFESDANAITSARNELNNWQRNYDYDKTKSRIENSVKNSPQSVELEANNEVLKELNHNVDVYERKRTTALDNIAERYKPVLDEIEKTQKTLKDAQERYDKIVEKASAQKLLKGSLSDWTTNRKRLLDLGKDYADILGAINKKKNSVDSIGKKIQALKNNSSTANKNIGKVSGSSGKIKGVTGAINGLNNAIKKLDYKALKEEAYAAQQEAEALAHYASSVANAKKNGPNLIERYKASVKKTKKHASGVANIKSNEFAVVGENPNKEIVLGSQLNNGVMMGLEKGSGVVNAQSTNTLAGILNSLGSSNINAKQTRLASDGQVINIQNLTLPNVNNGEDFVKYLQNFRDDILRKG